MEATPGAFFFLDGARYSNGAHSDAKEFVLSHRCLLLRMLRKEFVLSHRCLLLRMLRKEFVLSHRCLLLRML
jgi:hypothetical protein